MGLDYHIGYHIGPYPPRVLKVGDLWYETAESWSDGAASKWSVVANEDWEPSDGGYPPDIDGTVL